MKTRSIATLFHKRDHFSKRSLRAFLISIEFNVYHISSQPIFASDSLSRQSQQASPLPQGSILKYFLMLYSNLYFSLSSEYSLLINSVTHSSLNANVKLEEKEVVIANSRNNKAWLRLKKSVKSWRSAQWSVIYLFVMSF